MTSLHDLYPRQVAEWVSMAPFGAPVVPEVNMMLQRSSPPTFSARATTAAASTSPARSMNDAKSVAVSGTEPRSTMTSSSLAGSPASVSSET